MRLGDAVQTAYLQVHVVADEMRARTGVREDAALIALAELLLLPIGTADADELQINREPGGRALNRCDAGGVRPGGPASGRTPRSPRSARRAPAPRRLSRRDRTPARSRGRPTARLRPSSRPRSGP